MNVLIEKVTQQNALGLLKAMRDLFVSWQQPKQQVSKAQRQEYYSFEEKRTKTQRQKDNNAVFALLDKLDNGELDAKDISEEERQILAKYSGNGGGLKGRDGKVGSAHEYYTPAPVAQAMWDTLKEMGFSGGRVLDPCAGTGIFGVFSPENAIVDAVELDNTSAKVNELVNGDDKYSVQNKTFEEYANQTDDEIFDAIVTNVPFGDNSSRTGKNKDKKYQNESLEGYFVLRSLDKLKPKGLGAFLVPSSFVSGKSGREPKVRLSASLKAEFLGAYRLPNKVFDTAGADVVTDIVFFRKYDKDTAVKIKELQSQDTTVLHQANVLWDTFLDGDYFKDDGRKYILGTVEQVESRWGGTVQAVMSNDSITNIAKAVRPFGESRVNWALLDTTETSVIVYGEGDIIHRDGATLVYKNGQFVVQSLSEQQQQTKIIADRLIANLQTPLDAVQNNVGFNNAMMAATYYKQTGKTIPKWLNQVEENVRNHKDAEILFDVCTTALAVKQAFDSHVGEHDFNFLDNYSVLSKAMQENRKKPIPNSFDRDIRDCVTLLNQHCTLSGFSDFWRGERGSLDNQEFTTEQKIERLQYENGSLSISLQAMQEIDPHFDIMTNDDWVISADGEQISRLDDILVGNCAEVLQQLDSDIANAKNTEIAAKLSRVKALAMSRIKSIDVNKLRFNVRTPFVKPHELEMFLKANYSKIKELKVYIDDDGKGHNKAIIRYPNAKLDDEKLLNRIGQYLKGDNLTLGNIELSGYKKKADAMRALRRMLEELNTRFNTWVHANPQIMERIKNTANDPENLYFEQPSDGRPLKVHGLNDEWNLHDYQASFVRQQSRFFGGINGFDVGLGKTFTALATVQYAHSVGTKKKTVFIVPKSVLSNWYKESISGDKNRKGVYTDEVAEKCLFVGGDIVDGKLVVKPSNYTRDLNLIVENKHNKVFMSLEAFLRIPMKEQTAINYKKYLASVDSGIDYVGEKSKAKSEVKEAKANDITEILTSRNKLNVPFLEDMEFDSIVIDEAHFFKNSKRVYNFDSKVKGLGNINSPSTRGIDIGGKTWYLRGKRGDGVLGLTATPITNSPLELYSMMSLTLGEERINKTLLDIRGTDDFMESFCQIEGRDDTNILGNVVSTDLFTGLKNIELLRSLIHSGTTIKNAKDVGLSIKVPDAERQDTSVVLTDDVQRALSNYKAVYNIARKFMNDELLSRDSLEFLTAMCERLGEKADVLASPFSLINKMSNLILDKDLDDRATFYTIDGDVKNVQKAIAKFNKLKRKDTVRKKPRYTDENNYIEMLVEMDIFGNEKFEYQVTVQAWIDESNRILLDTQNFKIIEEFDQILDECKANVGVSISPKLASLVDNMKKEQAHIIAKDENGKKLKYAKQIVFCDSLPLHNKLKRIISSEVGIPKEKITFISGVKNGDIDEILDVQAGFNDNENNVYSVIIANEKAEVGINLQKGTQAIHHLTIQWTPDSIQQRNGRGVRQGNTIDKVNVYYYDADGTFDNYRRTVVERKGEWIGNLLNNKDIDFVQVGVNFDNKQAERILLTDGSSEDLKAIQEEIDKIERDNRKRQVRNSQVLNLSIYKENKKILDEFSDFENWVNNRDGFLGEMNSLFEAVYEAKKRLEKSIEKDAKEATIRKNKEAYEKAVNIAEKFVEKYNDSIAHVGRAGEKPSLKLFFESIDNMRYSYRTIWGITVVDGECLLRDEWKNQIQVAENMLHSAQQAMLNDAKDIEGAFTKEQIDTMIAAEKPQHYILPNGDVVSIGAIAKKDDGYIIMKEADEVIMCDINGVGDSDYTSRGGDTAQWHFDQKDLVFYEVGTPQWIEYVQHIAGLDVKKINNEYFGDIEKAVQENAPILARYLPQTRQYYPTDKLQFVDLVEFEPGKCVFLPPVFPRPFISKNYGFDDLKEKQYAFLEIKLAGERWLRKYLMPREKHDKYVEQRQITLSELLDGMKAFNVKISLNEDLRDWFDWTIDDNVLYFANLLNPKIEAINADSEQQLCEQVKQAVIDVFGDYVDGLDSGLSFDNADEMASKLVGTLYQRKAASLIDEKLEAIKLLEAQRRDKERIDKYGLWVYIDVCKGGVRESIAFSKDADLRKKIKNAEGIVGGFSNGKYDKEAEKMSGMADNDGFISSYKHRNKWFFKKDFWDELMQNSYFAELVEDYQVKSHIIVKED